MNKWATIAGVILIAGFCALGFVELMKSHIPYYTQVSKVRASEGKELQFMGSIVTDAVRYDSENNILRFQLRDPKGEKLDVVYEGVKPANFDTAPRAVVVGKYEGSLFAAKQLLTSCPSRYQGK